MRLLLLALFSISALAQQGTVTAQCSVSAPGFSNFTCTFPAPAHRNFFRTTRSDGETNGWINLDNVLESYFRIDAGSPVIVLVLKAPGNPIFYEVKGPDVLRFIVRMGELGGAQ